VNSFHDGTLARLAENPLSEQSRAAHRNLLLIGSLSIVVAELNLVPTRISALGVDLDVGDQHGIRWALLIAVIYFGVAFLAPAVIDFAAWRGTHTDARQSGKTTRANIARFTTELQERAQAVERDPNGLTTAHTQFQEAVAQLFDVQRRHTLYRLLVPVDVVRAVLDFAVPLAVGTIAIVVLVIGLL
jgi:hypothetical protein